VNYNETELNYNKAIEEIEQKAIELLNIDNFNEQAISLQKKYYEKKDLFDTQIATILNNFHHYREIHLADLITKLSTFELTDQIKTFSEGNIFDSLDEIEEYLNSNQYVEALTLILAINIFSSYKSINKISKKQYPNIKELLNQQKYALEFKVTCPFCGDETNIKFYSRTQPYSYKYQICDTLKCDCKIPSFHFRFEDKQDYNLQLIAKLFNTPPLIMPTLNENQINQLCLYANEKFPELYSFKSNPLRIYDEEKEFSMKPFKFIDKQIWKKIKEGKSNFNSYEKNIISKIPNSQILGVEIYSLRTIIQNITIVLRVEYDQKSTRFEQAQIQIAHEYQKKFISKINPQLISYVQNYETQKAVSGDSSSTKASQSDNDLLALGHFCKAENITMEDLCQLKSMLDFCKQNSLDLYDLKETYLSKV
jgi:hypothetical protein